MVAFTVCTAWACEAYILSSAMKPKKDGYGEKENSGFPPPSRVKTTGKTPGETPRPKRCFPRPGSEPIIDVKRAR